MPPQLQTKPIRVREPEHREWPTIPPTLVTIRRTSPADEQSRQIVCRLDGQLRAELLFGGTCTWEILPGPHSLLIHNTLMWKTLRFDAPPGGHVHVTVANRAGRNYYIWLFLVGVAPIYLAVRTGSPDGRPYIEAPAY